jgi:AraC family transcriptional activator FtrA
MTAIDTGYEAQAGVLTSRFLDASTVKRLHYYPRALNAVLFATSRLPDTVRVEDVAEHFGMNSGAFSRFFAEKTGMTFSALMKILRIERALEQLELRECSVEFLASHSGYGSGCTFTRAFKEVLGETPSSYRRRMVGCW